MICARLPSRVTLAVPAPASVTPVAPAPPVSVPDVTLRVARITAEPASTSLTEMPVPLRVSATCSVAA